MPELDTKAGIAIGAIVALLMGIFSQAIFAKQEQVIIQNGIPNTENSNNENPNIPCSYLIFIDSNNNIDAKNCSTGRIDFTSNDASTTINKAINSTQKSQMIFISQGDYVINHTSIELQHGTNIWGVSSGQSVTNGKVGTHLQLANNANINLMEYTKNNLGYFIHINNVYLDGNFAHNNKGNGTYFNANASDVEIENTYIDGFPQNCVVADNVFNYRFIGSTFEHAVKDGVFVKKGTDMIISSSKFLGNGQYGLEAGTTSNGVAGLRVIGDYFASNSLDGAVTFNSPSEIFEGNFFQEVSNTPSNNHLVLENACSNSQIIGNNFIASGHTGKAIQITHASCNNAQIIDNSISGTYAQSPLIVDSGTGTMIRHNTGFITEKSGTATVTNPSLTVVVNHGLSYTPNIADIHIEPQATWGNCNNWWVSTITSTQFTINCNASPAVSLAFSWSINRT